MYNEKLEIIKSILIILLLLSFLVLLVSGMYSVSPELTGIIFD